MENAKCFDFCCQKPFDDIVVQQKTVEIFYYRQRWVTPTETFYNSYLLAHAEENFALLSSVNEIVHIFFSEN